MRLGPAKKREAAMSLRALLNAHGGPDILMELVAWLEAPPVQREKRASVPEVPANQLAFPEAPPSSADDRGSTVPIVESPPTVEAPAPAPILL